MSLSLSPDITLPTINPELLSDTIIQFWNNYLYFQQLPQVGETRVISHNTGDMTHDISPSGLTEDDILVFEHTNTGRIISAPAIYRDTVESCIDMKGYSINILQGEFESITQKQTQIFGPVVSYYLFSTENLLPIDLRVHQLLDRDKAVYDDFIQSCIDNEVDKVDMNFDDPTHRFFSLKQDGHIVSLGNYSIDAATGIAHIGIITPKRNQGNGYGKILVNTIIHDSLQHNLTTQYRVHKTNIASHRIALSLGFTPTVESYTLVVI